MSTLIERLGRWAREFPDDVAYTYFDYSADVNGVEQHLTWSELDRRAQSVAAAIRASVEPGKRAAILAPQTMDYVVAFFGALYARVIAVPLFSPDLPGHADRLLAVYNDADPTCVLTTSPVLPQVYKFLNDNALPQPKEIVAVDALGPVRDSAQEWAPGPVAPGDIAYLQYTSGSTRTPAGVIITHGNFTANAEQLWGAFDGTPRTSCVAMWLPLFHDMGLVSICGLTLVHGNPAVFMDPVSFIMRPVRWLEMLGTRDDTFTGGPNFAYEYLTAQVSDEEKRALDLSRVSVFMNGAEPIRERTLDDFFKAFSGCGLRAESQVPAYGLAEATVYVSASARDRTPTVTAFDRAALTRGTALPCPADADGASALVACGEPWGQQVLIVDPETRVALPDRRVGEIWVHGPNVAAGYWGRPETTREIFQATLAEPAAGHPDGPWLRTGDLGVLHDGELYVTGRIKDLIIVDGRNHYPQDLEYTAWSAHPAVRREYAAAFAITPEDAGGDTEGVVVIAERNRRVPAAHIDLGELAGAVRGAIKLGHDVRLHDFVLIEPGGLPRTSSAKIARAACRQAYLDGALPVFKPR